MAHLQHFSHLSSHNMPVEAPAPHLPTSTQAHRLRPPSSHPRFHWTAESVIAHIQALEAARRDRLRKAHCTETARRAHAKTIICISDTHGKTPSNVPDGDVLIHAGDLTSSCSQEKLQRQLDWINSLPHTHKICIAGNHDLWLDPEHCSDKPDPALIATGSPETTATRDPSKHFPASNLNWGSIHYLLDTTVLLNFPDGTRLTVYGSPRTARFGTPGFQFDPRHCNPWAMIPPCDILVTHGPAKFYCDGLNGSHFGDAHLLTELWRLRPKLFVHGHIHESAGREILVWDTFQRSYEDVLSGRWRDMSLSDLLVLMVAMIWLSLGTRLGDWTGRTVVINAAIGPNGPFVERLAV